MEENFFHILCKKSIFFLDGSKIFRAEFLMNFKSEVVGTCKVVEIMLMFLGSKDHSMSDNGGNSMNKIYFLPLNSTHTKLARLFLILLEFLALCWL